MEYAWHYRLPGVRLLLDQEKAYDWVHPTYLRNVLLHVGLPSSLVLSLCSLFFSTSSSVLVNGFISNPVNQGRGLRQGDPISPVLFNLAFDPLRRSVLADPLFTGFSMHKHLGSFPMVSPAPIKVPGYADGALCFLSTHRDFHQLQSSLLLYSRASNAKVDFHKTEEISLSGARQVD